MFGETPLIIVEDTATLTDVVESLRGQPVIGVDTEADSFHHYREKVCLIQVSDLSRDFILDPLRIEDLSALGPLLADPDTVKVLHGGDYDIVSLGRDYNFTFRNVFDTMISAQFLGMPHIGLAHLIDRYFGHQIDKKYQRHDWASRPLLPEHLEYARGDTHWLPALREILLHRLRHIGRIEALNEECTILEQRRWSGRGDDDSADFLRVKQSKTLDPTGLRVLRALWRYRDTKARASDRPAFKVIPDPVLLALARNRPSTTDGLHRVTRRGSTMVRRHGNALLAAIETGLADETPLPSRPRRQRSSDSSRSGGPGVERLMGVLKAWRNDVVQARRLSPVVVMSNTLLKEVARAAPTTLEELQAVEGIRRWQVQEYGEELLSLVGSVATSRHARSRRKRSG